MARGEAQGLAEAVAAGRAALVRPALRPRQLLGKYRIERRIAQGGFAEVYRAKDTIEGVPVALKIPYAHLVDEALLADFRREVRLAAPLDHPNVLPIKNAQFVDGRFVIAYPLGSGTLADRMAWRLAAPRRVDYATQMLAAVAHAHARRIIHCDLKPENFILFPGDRVRLADFGISRLSRRTVLGVGLGHRRLRGARAGDGAHVAALRRLQPRADPLAALRRAQLPEWPFRWPLAGPARGCAARRTPTSSPSCAARSSSIPTSASRRAADGRRLRAAARALSGAGGPGARSAGVRRREGPAGLGAGCASSSSCASTARRLQLHGECGRCKGPIAESMQACPWCGHALARWRDETRHAERCTRCGRGRKPDWRYCAWCYGPAFRRVSARRYSDRTYTERCANARLRAPRS